ncbi:MAG: hypothetical protein Ct9H300mP7_2160 [Verrucomicrobiota bacterium]|nr:MAG: hypothetical protein Ct9H300mP7_2160 [Verrucomicrobiota bacterium]
MGQFKLGGEMAEDAGSDDLKAQVVMARSLPGIVGSFMGGWMLASLVAGAAIFLTA